MCRLGSPTAAPASSGKHSCSPTIRTTSGPTRRVRTTGACIRWARRPSMTYFATSRAPTHRIVFGTDSTAPERYRADIVREQQEVLERLEVDERDRAAIFTNNARRLLRLSPSVDYDGAPTERRTARATAARGPT